MRQASRYSIGGRPTVRVKRSKNAERESAAVCASSSPRAPGGIADDVRSSRNFTTAVPV
jgi:hypothetical protein